jgi:hypothetical protein
MNNNKKKLDSSICKCANVSAWVDYSFLRLSFLDSQTPDSSTLETQILDKQFAAIMNILIIYLEHHSFAYISENKKDVKNYPE